MIKKWRNQKETPTPKPEVGKNKINNQVLALVTYCKLNGQPFSRNVATKFVVDFRI